MEVKTLIVKPDRLVGRRKWEDAGKAQWPAQRKCCINAKTVMMGKLRSSEDKHLSVVTLRINNRGSNGIKTSVSPPCCANLDKLLKLSLPICWMGTSFLTSTNKAVEWKSMSDLSKAFNLKHLKGSLNINCYNNSFLSDLEEHSFYSQEWGS